MTERMRQLGTRVQPRSAASIREEAQALRDELGLKGPFVKVVNLLEVLQELDLLNFQVIKDKKLPDDEAITLPDKEFIQIRESVYENAFDNHPRSRFTIAHELGHLFMHKHQASFARGSGEHKIFEDSEWQADVFASEFLIDERILDKSWDAEQIAEKFCVSLEAAECRLRRNKKES